MNAKKLEKKRDYEKLKILKNKIQNGTANFHERLIVKIIEKRKAKIKSTKI